MEGLLRLRRTTGGSCAVCGEFGYCAKLPSGDMLGSETCVVCDRSFCERHVLQEAGSNSVGSSAFACRDCSPSSKKIKRRFNTISIKAVTRAAQESAKKLLLSQGEKEESEGSSPSLGRR